MTQVKATTRVVVFSDSSADFMKELYAQFPEVVFTICDKYANLPKVLDRIRPQVVFATKFAGKNFPRETLLGSENLEWLSVAFAGVDGLYPWDDNRIVVTNAAGVAAQEMAQYAMASLFGLYQLFPYFASKQSEQIWAPKHIRSASGATIGLFGLGHTGKAIADSLSALGMRVVACRANPRPYKSIAQMFGADELHLMLGQVDATIACAALTPQTKDLFDQAVFKTMRPGSFFINMGRGELVVEQALIDMLNSGHLAGAALDVVRDEPMHETSNPLWRAPNLMITPHSCSEFDGWVTKTAQMFADNLERWLDGYPLENQVTSKRGY